MVVKFLVFQGYWSWNSNQFSSVQSLSRVWLFATPWIAARQASLSITNSRSLPKLMSIESVMPSSHLILCHPLLLLSPILPSIRVFPNESTLHMSWPKFWSFSFNISPSNEHPALISFRMGLLDLPAVKGTLKSLLRHQFQYFGQYSNTLWPPDAKNWLIWKDPDAGKDWRWEKGVIEDETVGWHHQLIRLEFE